MRHGWHDHQSGWNGFLISLLLWPGVATHAAVDYETVAPETLLTMDRRTLETAQGKLDYLGPQTGELGPITFTIDGHQVDWELFQDDAEHERWSTHRQPSFTVGVEELHALLQRAQPLFDRVDSTEPWLAFMVVVGQPGQARGFERRLNREQTKTFFGELWQAFHGRAARSTFQWWGCALDLLPAGRAMDVTDGVEITVGRFQPDGVAGRYSGHVSVRNISAERLPAPVSVVLDLRGSAQVIDPDGTTCHVEPVGRPYLHALLANGAGLEAGANVDVPATVEQNEQEPVVFTVRVLAGPNSR